MYLPNIAMDFDLNSMQNILSNVDPAVYVFAVVSLALAVYIVLNMKVSYLLALAI